MATVPYPSTLPLPVRDSYQMQFGQPIKRTRMEMGARVRRRWMSEPQDLTISWKFTNKQLGIFDAWLAYDLKYGQNWFSMALSRGAVALDLRLSGDAPQARLQAGGDWLVEASCMRLQPGILQGAPSILPMWPSDLPLPMENGYSHQIEDLFLEDNLKEGLGDNRSRYDSKTTLTSVNWIMTAAEREKFLTFYRQTLLNGLCPFRMTFKNGAGFADVRCRFSQHFNESPSGAAFAISAQIATFRAPLLTEAQYRSLL